MRHATTDVSGDPDHDPMDDVPLNRQGRSEARLMGRFLRDSGLRFDIIVSSPFERAHQTAKRVAKRIGGLKPVLCDGLLPDRSPEDAWDCVLKVLRAAQVDDRVLIVSHGPLIQGLVDLVCGLQVNNWSYRADFIHGSIAHCEDGKLHWFATPKLIGRARDELDKINEAGSLLLQVAENMDRAVRRKAVAHLETRLKAAVLARFRAQGAEARRALKAALKDHFQESDGQGGPVPAGVTVAALGALATHRPIKPYQKLTSAAYSAGSAAAADDLDYEGDADVGGYSGSSDGLERQIDSTTGDRVRSALVDAFGAGLGAAAILGAVSGAFDDEDRAQTIADNEITDAFHSGMTDAAAAISLDTGDDIEKLWDAEDDACDDCAEAADEDWVDIDYEYPSVGDSDPPAHPNCRCSLRMRRASDEEP